MSGTTKPILFVTIVHGTWAHGFGRTAPNSQSAPRWYQRGGGFFDELEAALRSRGFTVEMESFLWSGDNSLAARADAAHSLSLHLQRQAAAFPTAWRLIVGHSHGGTVIASTLQQEDTVVSRLAAVSIATPFLDLQSQPVGKLAKGGILMLLFLLFYGFGYSHNQEWLSAFMPSGLASAIVCLVIASLSWIVTVRLLSDHRLATVLQQNGLCRSISPPFLVLRAHLDEAALAILGGNTAERLCRLARGACAIATFALCVLIPLVGIAAGIYFLLAFLRQPGEPWLIGFVLMVGGWILNDWRNMCVLTGACLLFAGVLRAVNGRELVRCVEGVSARLSAKPNMVVAPTIEVLRPRGCFAHSLYQHPEVAVRIASWLERIVRTSPENRG